MTEVIATMIMSAIKNVVRNVLGMQAGLKRKMPSLLGELMVSKEGTFHLTISIPIVIKIFGNLLKHLIMSKL